MSSDKVVTFTTLAKDAEEKEKKLALEEEEKTSTSVQHSQFNGYTVEEHDKIMQDIEEFLVRCGLHRQSSPKESN